MTVNIKQISLWEDNPMTYNSVPVVKVDFVFPCEWTVFNLEDLKNILRCWIEGEERRYPISGGYRGRWLLFEEIKKVFEEEK